MKKRIAAIFLVGLLFAFLCSVPASATVSDNYTPTQSYKGTEFGQISARGLNSNEIALHISSFYNVSEFSAYVSGCSSLEVWCYPVVNSSGSSSPFVKLKDGEKYVMTLKYKILYDGVYNSGYTNALSFFESYKYINSDITKNFDSGTYTFKTTFTLSDIDGIGSYISSEAYEPYSFCFTVSGFSGVEYIDVSFKSFSIEIYDSANEDYGYTEDEETTQGFADSLIELNQSVSKLWLDMKEFENYLEYEMNDFIDSLQPFKNFCQDIYSMIPDYIEFLISFIVCFLVARRAIGR